MWIDVICIVVFIAMLILATITDIKQRIILNIVPLSITIVGLIRLKIVGVCGLLIVGGIWYIISAVSKDKLGMGDVKLMAACGCFFGPILAMYQSVICCLIAIIANYKSIKSDTSKTIPLAPYISIGAIILLIMEIVQWHY